MDHLNRRQRKVCNKHPDPEQHAGGRSGEDVLTLGIAVPASAALNVSGNTFDGGAGFDTAGFSGLSTGVTIDLAAGSLQIGPGANTIQNVEKVIGSAAADSIAGSGNAEIFEGGADADTFVFAASFGLDDILDFTPGLDTLEFSTSLFADATAVLAATADDGLGNTVITYDASSVLTLESVVKANLSAGDFTFV